MPIKIANRLNPFSHLPGVELPLPFTQLGVQVFPAALKVLPHGNLIKLPLKGPVENFTVTLDLQRGAIKVQAGEVRYWLFGKGKELYYHQEKGIVDLPFVNSLAKPASVQSLEELSLGSSKKLDWELVKRRHALEEILPIWFRLGQLMPSAQEFSGESLYTALSQGDYGQFGPLFRAGFRGIFWPQKEDTDYTGFNLPPLPPEADPGLLLTGGYRAIRSLLLQESNDLLYILPTATKLFHAGRALHLKFPYGSIDLEWSKNRLKKMFFHCTQTTALKLKFPSEIKRFRISVGKELFSMQISTPISFIAGSDYLLDHFER